MPVYSWNDRPALHCLRPTLSDYWLMRSLKESDTNKRSGFLRHAVQILSRDDSETFYAAEIYRLLAAARSRLATDRQEAGAWLSQGLNLAHYQEAQRRLLATLDELYVEGDRKKMIFTDGREIGVCGYETDIRHSNLVPAEMMAGASISRTGASKMRSRPRASGPPRARGTLPPRKKDRHSRNSG